MKQNNFGRIINVSSVAGSLALYGQSAAFGAMLSYRSSKTLLNLLTLYVSRNLRASLIRLMISALAHELKDYNILVNAYNPGPVDTGNSRATACLRLCFADNCFRLLRHDCCCQDSEGISPDG